ncbi:MAG: hypothetical protein PHP21_04470 [Patescibacteria group bacterium]|nr:hypothetical protein [Patescibacteria group bacterium]
MRQPVISKGAGEEKGGLIGKIEEPVSGSGQELPLSISPTGDIERGKSISGEETAGVGSRITGEEKKTADLIDESEQAQGKLGVNLIVFIVFILGVIGWIFWVNRELVKEQRAGEKSQEDFFSEGKKEDNSSDNSGENKLF